MNKSSWQLGCLLSVLWRAVDELALLVCLNGAGCPPDIVWDQTEGCECLNSEC